MVVSKSPVKFDTVGFRVNSHDLDVLDERHPFIPVSRLKELGEAEPSWEPTSRIAGPAPSMRSVTGPPAGRMMALFFPQEKT